MIHEQLRKNPKVQEAIKKAEDAFAAFTNAGGEVYWDRHEKYLSVNVKTNIFEHPPELKDDDDTRHRLWDKEVEEFWMFDMSEDDFRVVLGTDTYHFPKVYSAGRMGGHLIFDWKEDRYQHETVIDAIRENRTIEEELSIGDLWRFADDEWEPTDDTDEINDAIADVIYEFESITTFLEDATKWVKHVVACKKYREKNLEGVHWEFLVNLCDIYPEWFDLENCTAVFNQEEQQVTVSWPQHARVFEDVGGWYEADACTPGSVKWADDVFRVWAYDRKQKTFNFTMTFKEFIDALSPEVAEARRLLSK